MIGPLPTAIANSDAPAVEGQVEVAEGVALADGVVLDAAPGCRLVLAPGVCVGSGAIIQAVRGDLILEPGAVLGSGVLIFGTGRIGQNVCIGAESTLIHPVIPSGQVVPPNSLIGDPSQSSRNGTAPNPAAFKQDVFVHEVPPQEASSQEIFMQETLVQETLVQAALPEDAPGSPDDAAPQPPDDHGETEAVTGENLETEQADSSNTTNGTRPPAHGQKQVQELLTKLFPHRQPLNGVTAGCVSPEDKP